MSRLEVAGRVLVLEVTAQVTAQVMVILLCCFSALLCTVCVYIYDRSYCNPSLLRLSLTGEFYVSFVPDCLSYVPDYLPCDEILVFCTKTINALHLSLRPIVACIRLLVVSTMLLGLLVLDISLHWVYLSLHSVVLAISLGSGFGDLLLQLP